MWGTDGKTVVLWTIKAFLLAGRSLEEGGKRRIAPAQFERANCYFENRCAM
jgi:hypothetical protein